MRYDKEFVDYQQTEAYKHYLECQFSSDSGSAPSHKKKKSNGVGSQAKLLSLEDSEADISRDPGPQVGTTSSLTF